MGRLTEKDEQGIRCLKRLPWKGLCVGEPITQETYEALYGALCKLLDYEESGLSPDQLKELDKLYLEKCQEAAGLQRQWITLWLPKEGESVLATVDGKCENIEFKDAVLFASFICGEGWILDDYPECTEFTVKAWMYLPEPYHGEEVDNE